MKFGSDDMVQCVLAVVVILLVVYLGYNYMQEDVDTGMNDNMAVNINNNQVDMSNVESFNNCGDHGDREDEDDEDVMEGYQNVSPSEGLGDNEQPKGLGEVEGTQMNQLPAECYPKDVLSAPDLLPQEANSKYAQVAPSGQGSLQDKNFLTAGFHIGINTVGQTLRNANYQLRSDPPNPQVKVSPWNQTTIETDTNRRALEIGGN